MSTPEEEPRPEPETGPKSGHYGEVAPGVPRYGQYAPEGYHPPAQDPVPGAPSGGPGIYGQGHKGQPGPAVGWPPAGTPGGAGALDGNGARIAPPRPVEIAFRLILLAGLIEAIVVVLGLVA
ncbi:MAG TPA: hypothetical protein VIG41_08535, partial [Micrococcaceae bacterium]